MGRFRGLAPSGKSRPVKLLIHWLGLVHSKIKMFRIFVTTKFSLLLRVETGQAAAGRDG